MSFNGTLSGSGPIVVEVLQGANSITNGLLGLFIVVVVMAIIYYRNRSEPPKEAFVGALFIGVIVGVLLRLLGLLDDFYLGVIVVLSIVTIVLLYIRRDQ